MIETLPFSEMTDKEVRAALVKHKISLTVSEARKVEDILGRPPTLTEATIWGIQGSEHSSYKSSRKYLNLLPTDAPNVLLGPTEDSGIVEVAREGKKRFGIVMSHESHNHPSQIVPYEGAATGVGGVVRDIACMGSQVIASLDALRFGNIKKPHAQFIAEEVVSGVAGYGNPLGVPNLGGDVFFDNSYDDNCLVNVVAFGVIEKGEIIHSTAPKNSVGYDIIFVGKPTDMSGMGGAAFASGVLDEKDKETNKGAVQEPNPFLQRHILAATYDLFEILKKKKLLKKVGFKDMGAGGNLCASVELVDSAGLGAEINLDKIHQAFKNLPAHIVACSETQERFCWVSDPKLTKFIIDHYNKTWDLPSIAANARASVAGKVKKGNYVLKHKGKVVCDAPPEEITRGLRYDRPIKKQIRKLKEPKLPKNLIKNIEKDFLKLLASENIASRVNIFEQYDKNVQGKSVIEPGLADAGVLAPFIDRDDASKKIKQVGIAVSVDGNGMQGAISPYYQAVNAVIESLRNVAAVGAVPQAITDCLNYGNPEKPDQMWEFVEGVKGVTEACKKVHLKDYKKYPTPIISGNVSFYNESKRGSINPSAVISCVGNMPDYSKAITMQLKETGSDIYLLGSRKNELGASEFYRLYKALGANIPKPDLKAVEKEIFFVTDVIQAGLVNACHDISEGGLAITLAEMAMGGKGEGNIGYEINLDKVPAFKLTPWQKLFSETGGFVLEISQKNLPKVKKYLKRCKIPMYKIGHSTPDTKLAYLLNKKKIINIEISKASDIWLNALRNKM